MLDIKKVQSINDITVSGILNELEIEEGVGSKGPYVRGTAYILVEQEIDGQMIESIVPIKMFSSRKKTDGGDNKNYDRILGYRDSLISIAASDRERASRVTVNAEIRENTFISKNGDEVNTYDISTNFINKKRESDKEGAYFQISGVVLATKELEDKEGESLDKLEVKLGVIGFNGKINVIPFIAAGPARAHVSSNYEIGDTINIAGAVVESVSSTTEERSLGWGETVGKPTTKKRRELLILGGSETGLEEALSYDSDDIKMAMAERKKFIEEKKANASKSAAASAPTKAPTNFGF